ncbi:MAG TPA: TetR/AcrR family transcriptional regulator [Gammaproteobacteria bacterium]|jgi:AcrR family transcriptional regulator|nr:TetR/AcrR family transcriptional regulator [Gammaproteobacteria bacterium]
MGTFASATEVGGSGGKRAAILIAATDLIIEQGYDGTSLEAICERAACSKSSIYGYFGNKEGLLAALTENIALDLSQALHALHLQQIDVEEALKRYARLALSLVLDDRHIAIVRATIAAVWKYPRLGPAYYEVGALTAQSALSQYFEARSRDGVLNVPDPHWAAKEFQGVLLWDGVLAQIVGAASCPDAAEIEARADAVVAAFLRRHRVSR